MKTTDEVIHLLSELVSVPSMNGNEAGVSKLVYQYTQSLGMDVYYEEVEQDRSNVIAKKKIGKGGKTIVLNTHMDVVPVVNGWASDPFHLTIRQNKAYGRGACDAKGPLACMLLAIRNVINDPGNIHGEIIMTAVVDEEDFSHGAKKMVQNGFNGDYGIVGEPTSCKIAPCHKGSMRPIIRVTGKTAHASLPEQGINAIEGAAVFTMEMKEYSKQLKKINHYLLGNPTMAITKLVGGVKENVIPDSCELIVDRRMVPGETEEEVVDSFKKICALTERKMPGIKVDIKALKETTGGPTEISPECKYTQAALDIATDVTGNEKTFYGLTCGCDMVHLMKCGIPTIVVGPGSLNQAHQTDEFVDITQLERCITIYENIIRWCLS